MNQEVCIVGKDYMVFNLCNLPPMPRNRSHTLMKGMNIKTQLARDFEKDLTERLGAFGFEFVEFASLFNKKKHFLRADYTIYTPENELFTKDECISSRAVDTDAHKLFQDTIFKCLGLDDKVIRQDSHFTPVSKSGDWDYLVTLKIRDLKDLYV